MRVKFKQGTVVVFGDCHFWPKQKPTTAFRALRAVLDSMVRADLVVCIGDVLDFPAISRYERIGWEKRPSVVSELKVAQHQMDLIMISATRHHGTRPRFIWALGNHDARFNKYIAAKAPALEGLQGTQLKDFFPDWEPCWELELNNDAVLRHSFKATPMLNMMHYGKGVLTGHRHRQNLTLHRNGHGLMWGGEVGMIAKVGAPQFEGYTEGAVQPWVSGFAVLYIHGGKIDSVNLATVLDEKKGLFTFRGFVSKV